MEARRRDHRERGVLGAGAVKSWGIQESLIAPSAIEIQRFSTIVYSYVVLTCWPKRPSGRIDVDRQTLAIQVRGETAGT